MMPDQAVIELGEKYGKDSDDLLASLQSGVLRKQIEPHESGVFIGFLISATAAQKHLKRGFKDRDIVYVSWATRTLLELLVWILYCSRSKENTRRFYQDSVRDLAGAMAAYRDLVSDTSRFTDEQRAIIDETETKTMSLAATFGVVPLDLGFLPVTAAADEVGMGLEYRKANKVLSKLVHPTAYMVCTSVMDGLAGNACENFFMAGVDYAFRAFAVLESFAVQLRAQSDPRPPSIE